VGISTLPYLAFPRENDKLAFVPLVALKGRAAYRHAHPQLAQAG